LIADEKQKTTPQGPAPAPPGFTAKAFKDEGAKKSGREIVFARSSSNACWRSGRFPAWPCPPDKRASIGKISRPRKGRNERKKNQVTFLTGTMR